MPRPPDTLLEREDELALLRARLTQAQEGRGGFVLVEGSAGAGKTALLARFRAESGDGARVLQAVGGELEREFPFGLVRQLFEHAVLGAPPEERERLLSGAAALAGSVIGAAPGDEAMELSADASFATLHGLYWLVAALAENEPLLLVVDDAHWGDAPSLRFLDFFARRAPELPVLVVVGLRPREPGAEHALLAGLADAPEVEVIRPTTLSAGAVRALVDDGLGEGTDDAVVAGALEATGGNPLLLSELIRTLSQSGVPATLEEVHNAVPSSVTRSVERRLGRLPEPARDLARAMAVLGERRDSAVLGAATGLDPQSVIEAFDALCDAELIEKNPPRFLHPLLRQAVADRVGGAERDRLHHRAAESLRHRPGAEDDVVVHLLASSPLREDWVLPALRASARRALAEGAPDAAVRRLERALEEAGGTGPEADELRLDLGRAAAGAGDPSAPEHLAVAAAAEDPAVAAQATEMQMNVGAFDQSEGLTGIAGRLREAVDRLGPDADPVLHDRLLGQLLNVMFVDSRLADDRARILASISRNGAGTGPGVLSHRAWDAAAGDAPAKEALELARQTLAGRPFGALATVEQPTPIWAVLALIVLDSPRDADAAIGDAEAALRRHPSSLGRSFATYMRAEWLLAFGSAGLAEATAREALELFEGAGNEQSVVSSRAALTSALVLRGALDDAAAIIAQVPGDEYFDVAWGGGLVWTSRAELRLAQGRPRDAVADLRRLAAFCRRYGWRRFPRGAGGAQLARALAMAGEGEEARSEAEAELADARSRGLVRLEVEALLALGLALEGDEALEAQRAAVDLAEESPSVLLRARAAFDLGSALRRANRRTDARAVLATARELSHKVDAAALTARATEELTVAGGRPRRIALSGLDALTPSERRVAEHAARGLSNREIAEVLFVTRKTVEFQLGGAYSKLGIRSRTQLAAALGQDAVESAQE